jgi:peptide deformylase
MAAEIADEFDLDLVFYPDPRLRRVAEPVEDFGEEFQEIVQAMSRRMHTSGGVGLAAPQVGLSRRVLIINPTGEPADELVLINPRILERTGPPTLLEEGCLSFPRIYAEIERPDECTVEARDPAGETVQTVFRGFPSRIIQHEHDHLEGVLLVDRMSPADKLRNKNALEELVARFRRLRAGGAGGGKTR